MIDVLYNLKIELSKKGFDLKLLSFNKMSNQNKFSFKYRNLIVFTIGENIKNGKYIIFDDSKINVDEFDLDTILSMAIEKCKIIDENKSAEFTYGCCGLYEKCSDLKECIQKDKEYAKGCSYKKNLEKGIIFYGKNRNI